MTNKHLNENLRKLQDAYNSVKKLSSGHNCFLSDCNNKSINSHSISKSRIFKVLTEEKSETLLKLQDEYSSDFSTGKPSTFQERNRRLVSVSQNIASTFNGFCTYCDSLIFRSLDNYQYVNNDETNFLHYLRAYAFKICDERPHFEALISSTNLISELENPIIKIPLSTILDKVPEEHIIELEDANKILKTARSQIAALSIFSTDKTPNTDFQNISEMEIINPDSYPMTFGKFKTSLIELLELNKNNLSELKESRENGKIKLINEYANEVLNLQKNTSNELTYYLRKDNYDKFNHLTCYVEGIYHITGNFIYYTAENDEFVLTFFPEKETNRTYFIFSVLNPTEKQKIYLKRINILSTLELKQFVSNIILAQGTNIYLSQGYFNTLNETEKETLSQIKVLKIFTTFNLFK